MQIAQNFAICFARFHGHQLLQYTIYLFFFDILIRKNETSQYYLLYFFCQMLCFVGNYRYFLEWNAFCKHASCCEEIDFCSSNTSEQRENLPTLLSHHLLTHSPNGQKYGNKCNLGNPQFAFNANINISFFFNFR